MLTDDFDLYYDFKFLEGIIFSDIVYTECSSFFTTIDELRQLEELVVNNRFMFDSHATNNISIIMQDLRYIEDDYLEERRKVINNIIHSINNDFIKDDNYDFYRYEMCVRYDTNKYRRLKESIIDKNKDLIDASIAFDSVILHTHTIDENSYNKHFNDFLDNPIYLMSIRAIINEYPLILNNDIFINRMNKVFSNSNDNKNNKALRKYIKKKRKK